MSGEIENNLWKAIEDKDYRKAKFLLRNGAQSHKLLEDGIAVIHFLSGISGEEANQLLIQCLENGASPNLPSCDGMTPVHVAASWGIFDNLSTLVEYGGNVDVRDADGMSPLDYAEQSLECQSKDCVKLLTDIVHDNKGLTYTKVKSKPDSSTVNRRQHVNKSSSVDEYVNGHKSSLATKDIKHPFYFINPSGYYYMDDLLTEDEASNVSFDQTEDNDSSFVDGLIHNVKNPRQAMREGSKHHHITLANPQRKCYFDRSDLLTDNETNSVCFEQTENYDYDSLFVNNFTQACDVQNPRKTTRGSKDHHALKNPIMCYIDGRDFMTEDELSSDSLLSANSSSSFHTANESEISMAFASALDDTVVTFPKLHPWNATQNDMDFDDTVIDGINSLDIRNTSTSGNIVIDNSINSTLSDGTVLYDWKEYSILEAPPSSDESDVSFVIPEGLLKMDCQQLKEELLKLGDDPGPIRADTRMLYVRRLARIQSGLTDGQQHSNKLKEYLPEVRAVIEGRLASPEMDSVEESMCTEFTKHSLRSKWREGTEKSSFNYILLDPRVTQNLPVRSKKMEYEDLFHTFVAAIFYVGKGKRSRPYAHLYEAISLNKTNRKLQQIRDIWSAGLGVVSLHCFQGVIPVEAYTREACLVEALGLARLTNQKRCDYYGRAKIWTLKKKRQMGVSLLKRALQIFLNDGERQMRPEDLRRSK